jgi:hypothetical protein
VRIAHGADEPNVADCNDDRRGHPDVLPLAFAIGQGSEMQQPLAIAIISGLLVQLPLVLLVMPVLHYLMRSKSA